MKRCTTLLLLAAMAAQLTACGGDAPAADTTAGDSAAADTTAAEVSEYVNPGVDYGGKTVTVAAHHYESEWKIDAYFLTVEEENGDVINDAIVKSRRAVEETLNVKFELMPLDIKARTDPSPLTKFILAGEDAFQISILRTAALPGMLATPSMVVDLNEIDTLDLSHSWWDQNSRAEYELYGRQFAVVGDMCFFTNGAPIVTYFNKTIVEDLKLDDLYKLVYDGKWTLDKMIKMSEEASMDLNGDSQISFEDRFGFAGEQSSMGYLLAGAGIRFSEKDKDGTPALVLNNERTASVTEKLKTFFRNDTTTVLDGKTRYNSVYKSVYSEYMVPTFMDNRLLFLSNQLLVALDLREMEADFGIIPPPKLDEAQKNYHSSSNRAWCDNVMIPATNTDLDMTGHVLDALSWQYQQNVTPAFIDQTVLGKSVRDEDSAKMIEIIRENLVYDVAIMFNWGSIVNKINDLSLKSDQNFASQYASVESAVTAAMTKTLDEFK
ncbi:MAG: hypothetical protein J6C52_09735 [Clostridia bacterium]|nr:hypothetical protein [Clostridia bacterium]